MDIHGTIKTPRRVYGLFAGNPASWATDEQELGILAEDNPRVTYIICSEDASITFLPNFRKLLRVKNIICEDSLLERIRLDTLFEIVKERMEPYKRPEDPFVERFNKLVADLLESNGIFNNCKLFIRSTTLEIYNKASIARNLVPLCLYEYHCSKEEGQQGAYTWVDVDVEKHADYANIITPNITLYPKDGKAVLHKMPEKDKHWETSDRLKHMIISIE